MDNETRFVFSTFSFLFWGGLVMWMCAGLTMLEAGSVRTKNASVICLKNIGVCSIACLTFYLVGYNIMFTGVEPGGWFGSLDLLHGPTAEERALVSGDGSAADAVVSKGHATMSYWLFQMVFLASAASIVSGIRRRGALPSLAFVSAAMKPVMKSTASRGQPRSFASISATPLSVRCCPSISSSPAFVRWTESLKRSPSTSRW